MVEKSYKILQRRQAENRHESDGRDLTKLPRPVVDSSSVAERKENWQREKPTESRTDREEEEVEPSKV